jgi:hypothetical protein
VKLRTSKVVQSPCFWRQSIDLKQTVPSPPISPPKPISRAPRAAQSFCLFSHAPPQSSNQLNSHAIRKICLRSSHIYAEDRLPTIHAQSRATRSHSRSLTRCTRRHLPPRAATVSHLPPLRPDSGSKSVDPSVHGKHTLSRRTTHSLAPPQNSAAPPRAPPRATPSAICRHGHRILARNLPIYKNTLTTRPTEAPCSFTLKLQKDFS